MIDADYYSLELVKSVAKLIDAETFAEVEEAFNKTVDRATQLVREKYSELARARVNEIRDDLHDERVQAQGGE